MAGLFDDLKKLGFDKLEDVSLFHKDQETKKNTQEKEELKIEDVLYDKSYECPVCGYSFKSKAIRSGKNRLVSTDTDLYSRYSIVNPIVYDCIMCRRCGYSAVSRSFSRLTSKQIEWIKKDICSKYKQTYYPDILTPKDAIERYKLALLALIVRKAKSGEKAYICLRIAWLYREIEDAENEKVFLAHAVEGFTEAYNKESFPLYELNEDTVAYLIAELNRRLGRYEEALRWVSYLIVNANISPRLKSRAQDLKQMINNEKNS